MTPQLRTARLLLRGWTDEDRAPFAAVNADPAVMARIGPLRTPAESDAMVDSMQRGWDERGLGLWCVELDGTCIGFTGLAVPSFDAPFVRAFADTGRPCVEVGWRLASAHWGRGYAPEAARAALAFAFGELGLDEVVSFTAAGNHRSRRVMEKLEMRRDVGADFDHPGVPAGSELRRHVLYRLRRPLVDA